MLRTYLENKQRQLMNKQVDFYTSSGIHVYFKDKIENEEIDMEKVISIMHSMKMQFFIYQTFKTM